MTDTNPNIFPAFRYDDAPAAMDWLQRAFGFSRHQVVPNPDGTIAHAELRLGSGMVMLGTRREGQPPNGSVYVAIDDVDNHCTRAREAGATIVMEPYDTDYGSREYAARDLEGNHWSFGTYNPFDYPAG
jgi:uncharacterized glyoxalase superfamily protein PhnB